jgi:hypothetical protein
MSIALAVPAGIADDGYDQGRRQKGKGECRTSARDKL